MIKPGKTSSLLKQLDHLSHKETSKQKEPDKNQFFLDDLIFPLVSIDFR